MAATASLAPRLDVRRLATLRAVAREGTFAAAAEALWLTPSAVSLQMTSLERDMGATLFARTSRGARLTDAGGALLRHAVTILDEVADAERELARLAGGEHGLLRFGSFGTATATFAGRAVARLRAMHDGVDLRLVDGDPADNRRRVEDDELDLALVLAADAPRGAGSADELRCEPLLDDPFLLVVPVDHPLAACSIVPLRALSGEPLLGPPAPGWPWGSGFRDVCARAGFEPRLEPCYRTADAGALQALVAEGRGLALVPRLALEHLRDDLAARPLEGAPSRRIAAALRRGVRPSPACEALLGVLRELAAA